MYFFKYYIKQFVIIMYIFILFNKTIDIYNIKYTNFKYGVNICINEFIVYRIYF